MKNGRKNQNQRKKKKERKMQNTKEYKFSRSPLNKF